MTLARSAPACRTAPLPAATPRGDAVNVVRDGTVRADSARIRTCIAVALACVAAGAFLFAAHLHGDAPEAGDTSASAHVRIERDGLVYSFDAISNRERLTEVGNPDVDLLRDRPAHALRLRRAT